MSAEEARASLEARIVEALAEAGVDGMSEHALSDRLNQDDVTWSWLAFDDAVHDLEERGVIRSCGPFALTPAEWGRRIVAEIWAHTGPDDEGAKAAAEKVGRMLAGVDPAP
jgi:hypothetical protein